MAVCAAFMNTGNAIISQLTISHDVCISPYIYFYVCWFCLINFWKGRAVCYKSLYPSKILILVLLVIGLGFPLVTMTSNCFPFFKMNGQIFTFLFYLCRVKLWGAKNYMNMTIHNRNCSVFMNKNSTTYLPRQNKMLAD